MNFTNEKYSVRFPVRYQDTDASLRATPMAIVGALQEAAILHAEALGRGMDWLNQRSFSWVIAQTRLKVLSHPAWRDELQVSTWPSEMGRWLSRREFVLCASNGSTLIVATTQWAFVDRKRMRVIRIPAEVAEAYPLFPERALDLPFGRPAPLLEPAFEKSYTAGRRDIDSNGHVNNLRYLDWMLEVLPDDLLGRWALTDLNIRYLRETGVGETVRIQAGEGQSSDGAARRFLHQVVNENGQSSAVAETIWGGIR
jgi:medium-chain acyl-[acyl-carrier-protein] hydrolase